MRLLELITTFWNRLDDRTRLWGGYALIGLLAAFLPDEKRRGATR